VQEKENQLTKNLIPNQWTTGRLSITDSTLDEAPELQRINDVVPQTSTFMRVEGKDEADCTMLSAIRDGVLPPTPDRSKEKFRLQSIRLSSSNELIGFLGVYHGFPSADIFWINTVTFHPDFQGKGYGSELLTKLAEIVKGLGCFSSMRTYVAINNIHSLRLCVKLGFNHLLAVVGEQEQMDTTNTYVLLDKPFETTHIKKDV